MNILKYSVIFLFSICIRNTINAQQVRNNFVRDTILRKELYEYLIERVHIYTRDSNGVNTLMDKESLQEMYGDRIITTRNLKTDSIIANKKVIGVYSCRFADFTSSPSLYIQSKDKIDFIDLDSPNFDLNQLLLKLVHFFDEYSSELTLKEKIKTLEGVIEIIDNRIVDSVPSPKN